MFAWMRMDSLRPVSDRVTERADESGEAAARSEATGGRLTAPSSEPERASEMVSQNDAGEVQVVPWPLLLKHKVTERVEAHPRYPWIVLATALFGLFSVGFTITSPSARGTR